jgi:type II secretory pathway component GspD/PulD (secretin)
VRSTTTPRPPGLVAAGLLASALVLAAAPAAGEVARPAPPQQPSAAQTSVSETRAAAPAPPHYTITVCPGRDEPRWKGERIDLSLRDADLVEVLRSFAKLGRFNLVLDPAVKGRVTVELRDVPWDAALAVILRTHGLAAEVDGRIVSVVPLPG